MVLRRIVLNSIASIIGSVLVTGSIAQDGVLSKFEFGLSVGAYKAHKYTAIRYDGFDGEYLGEYDFGVDYYLSLSPSNQYSVYSRIKQSYGDHDFTRREFPTNMKYNPGLAIGGYIGYKLSDLNTFFLSVDFVNLSINDALTFEVDDPSSQTSDPLIVTERLYGEEKRLSANLGFHFTLGTDPDHSPYFETGLNMTSIRVLKNSMIVQEKEYILTQWSKNPNVLYSQADYGGVGYGLFGGVGYRTRIQNQLLIDLGADVIFGKMPLGPDHLKKFKPQILAHVRIILN